jgi:coenzyme F420-0:L-glutamate ligase / coenzyme F420-1:gamma-L-glutamate ligase
VDLHVFAVHGIPDVTRGADVAALIASAVAREQRRVEAGDVFVVAQKIVSKAEGAMVRLDDVTPSAMASQWAAANGKDARIVEVILRESRRIVRMDHGILISETRHGFVCANAGVDASNVPAGFVTVLPDDPDRSAERLRVALGAAGLQPLLDYRGTPDMYGRPLTSTTIALADELAGAAEIVTRKSASTPVAIVRGAAAWLGQGSGRMLIRDGSRDLFR